MDAVLGRVSADFFTTQLNRLLQAVGGELVIVDETSCPDFGMFIEKLLPSEIGFIDIESREDINKSVKATLSCSLFLSQGVVHVRSHWCAYKEARAEEIVSSLLVPLHRNGLTVKASIRWSDDEISPLIEEDDFREEVIQVFRLAKYPYDRHDDKNNKMDVYVTDLARASEAYGKGFIERGAYHTRP